MDEASPGPGKDTKDPEAANQSIALFYKENKEWLFDKNRVCFCHVHRCWCPVYPGQALVTPDADVVGAPIHAMEMPIDKRDQPASKKQSCAGVSRGRQPVS